MQVLYDTHRYITFECRFYKILTGVLSWISRFYRILTGVLSLSRRFYKILTGVLSLSSRFSGLISLCATFSEWHRLIAETI